MRERENKQTNKQNKKWGNTPQEQKQLATPGIEFVQIKRKKKKTLFIYRSGDRFKKLVMISSTSEYNLKS